MAQTHPSQAPGTATARKAPSAAASVTLTHPERILYPDAGISKGELADYFAAVAAWLLPDLIGRPLSLVRCPEGVGAGCFYQKHAHDLPQEGLSRVPVQEENGRQREYVAVTGLAGVLNLLQAGVIELHTWGSHATALERPDRLVFDLDPHEGLDFMEVIRAAQEVRARLADLDLASFVKTTGGKGLHVHVPLRPEEEFDSVRGFAKDVAELMIRHDPDRFTLQQRVEERGDRIYFDIQRNGYAQMAVAPYSVRARSGAPVATPLDWAEAADADLNPHRFTMRTMGDRLAITQDPWAGMSRHRHGLTAARRRLKSLSAG